MQPFHFHGVPHGCWRVKFRTGTTAESKHPAMQPAILFRMCML